MSAARPVLLFDVMDTLVREPFYTEMPAFFGMTLEELLAAKHPTSWLEFELGRIDEDEMFARFFRDGREFDGAGLRACAVEGYRWLEGMEALLADLAGAGYAIHALSNYSVWWRLIEEKLALSRFLEWSFVSCDTGVRKPDPEAFLGAARALGVEPGACFLVDDREENCAAARAVGVAAHRFAGAEALRDVLL